MSDTFDPNASAPATPVAPAAPATPAFTPQSATPTAPATPAEDRSNWVPPYRIREISSRAEQALAQERATFAAERAAMQRQLQVLTGVVQPENPEIDQVRAQFKQVFPDHDWVGSQKEAIAELIELKDELRAAMQHQWTSHNRGAMDRLFKAAETTYGSPLNDEGKRELGAAFVGYLQSNPDAYERYQNDPTVVDEYWSRFTDRFISPIQRQQTLAAAGRIPGNIPQDHTSGAIPVSQAPKPATQDERLANALATYKARTTQGF